MFRTIRSEADVDALIAELEGKPNKDTSLTARMTQYTPRQFMRFLGVALGYTGRVVIHGATLSKDTTDLGYQWPDWWMLTRSFDLAFSWCSMDGAFIDTLMYEWLRNKVVEQLDFQRCKYIQNDKPAFPYPYGQITVDHLSLVSCEPELVHYVGKFITSMRVRELYVAPVDPHFVQWFSITPHLQSVILVGIAFDNDPGFLFAHAIASAGNLTKIHLIRDNDTTVRLPYRVARAIGAQPRTEISVRGNIRVSNDEFEEMVRSQTSLVVLRLTIEHPEVGPDIGDILYTMVVQNPHLKKVQILVDGHLTLKNARDLFYAVLDLRNIHQFDLPMDSVVDRDLGDRLKTYLRENGEREIVRTAIATGQMDPPGIIPVLITGAHRDVVYSHLEEHDAYASKSDEWHVANAIAACRTDGVEWSLVADSARYRQLLGEEFSRAIRSPVADPVIVPYAISGRPGDVFGPCIRVHALHVGDRSAFLNLRDADTDIYRINILTAPARMREQIRDASPLEIVVTDAEPDAAFKRRFLEVCPEMTWVPLGDLRAEILAQHRRIRRPRVPVRNALCTLAAVHAPRRALSAAEVAAVCADVAPGGGLLPCPYVYPLPGGGAVPRLPEALRALRDIFSKPVLLARIIPGARSVPSDWARTSVLPDTIILRVFHRVMESEEIPADDAVRLMTAFGVVFPVDGRRAVFPKFRHLSPALYRALAYLTGVPNVYNTSIGADGKIAFSVVAKDRAHVNFSARLDGSNVVVAADDERGKFWAGDLTNRLYQMANN
jgi:hypothetical protein